MSTTYYINGTNFSTATSVFTDAELTTCAPDGFYRLGGITRQQIGCNLLAARDCDSCGVVNCNNEVIKTTEAADTGSSRYFQTEFDLSSGADQGATVVVIELVQPITGSTKEIPTAIQATYNTANYSRVVRKVGDTNVVGTATVNSVGMAFPTPTVATDFIVVGGNDTWVSGTKGYSFYKYDGSSYVNEGYGFYPNISDNNNAQNDTSGNPDGPEYVVLVVPKTQVSVNELIVDILQQNISPTQLGFGFKMYVHCPTLLTQTNQLYGTGALGNLPAASALDACNATQTSSFTFYAVGSGTGLNSDTSLVTLNPTQPQLRDTIFLDFYGVNFAPSTLNGWWRIGNFAIRLEDGIVAETSSCAA